MSYKDIKKLKILLPSISEQQSIVDYIIKKTIVIDKSIAGIEQEISLITEYRTRLISDVVTGKLDVRDIIIDEATLEESEAYESEEEVINMEEPADDREGDE